MEARLEMFLLQWGCMTYASSFIWPIAPWEWERAHSIPVSWGRDAWVVIFDQGSRLVDFSNKDVRLYCIYWMNTTPFISLVCFEPNFVFW